MEFGDTEEEAGFRAEVRAWLEANAPRDLEPPDGGEGGDAYRAFYRAWQARLADAGWAGLTWPVEHGGRGLSAIHKLIFDQEQARFGLSAGPYTLSFGTVAPVLIAFASADQQARWLPPLRRGEQIWCQLFSEPGAGSDLAGLSTRAVQDGDEWVVTGQKIWSSTAHVADRGFLLARTDPDAPKHHGITLFGLDMSTPGIDVRAIRQATEGGRFNSVFFDDVRIPARDVIGPLHGGWRVATAALGNERASLGMWQARGTSFEDLVELARERGLAEDPVTRQRLAEAYTRMQLLRFFGYRIQTALSRGVPLGPETSVLKLLLSDHLERTTELGVHLAGPAGMLDERWAREHVGQWGLRIGGGTDQVQRNVVGERALGLPREPDATRGLPWRDLPH